MLFSLKRYFGHIPAKPLVICAAMFFVVMLIVHIAMPGTLFGRPTATVVYDRDGRLLGARIADDGQWRFGPIDSVPDKFRDCIICYEDRRFRWHWGIDPIALARAVKNDIAKGRFAEGGSTLTMQVARMARGNQSRTFWQKIVESLWAIDIETFHSKDEILRAYASEAPMGGNVVGLQAAAWRYFGRDAWSLSWAECATLAVLPNSPSLVNVGRNRNELKKKRDMLLEMLCEQQTITREECDLAKMEPLVGQPLPLPNDAPHFMDFVGRTAKGQTTHSQIDANLQKRVQNTANSHATSNRANHIENIAVLVLDAQTADVVAYIGNATNGTEAKDVDIIQSERSPGSLLKPLLYAAMISNGEITPRMLIADTPLSINGFTPHNFSRTFSGAVHADEAVSLSLNVPLVRMLSQHNTSRFMSELKTLGMTTLRFSEDHYGASLILGGAEATLWDLCHIYYNFIHNNGKILSESGIWFALEAMSAVNRPEEEADWQQFRSMKRIAWKTGTSWGSRDGWAIGITPKHIVGVWVGNATGEGRAGLTGIGYAAPLLFDVFAMLPDGGWFEEPLSDMEFTPICRQSGCIATDACAVVDTLVMPLKSAETKPCHYCRIIHTTKDLKWRVNSSCESIANMHDTTWFVLPPTQEYYYKKRHADYRSLPPMRIGCEDNSRAIEFIYPQNGATIALPKNFGGTREKTVVRVACNRSGAHLFWHVDGSYIGETRDRHEMAIDPKPGLHTITVVDEQGSSRSVSFTAN